VGVVRQSRFIGQLVAVRLVYFRVRCRTIPRLTDGHWDQQWTVTGRRQQATSNIRTHFPSTMTENRSIAPLVAAFCAGVTTCFIASKFFGKYDAKDRTNGRYFESSAVQKVNFLLTYYNSSPI
jgi:hypothetical protein